LRRRSGLFFELLKYGAIDKIIDRKSVIFFDSKAIFDEFFGFIRNLDIRVESERLIMNAAD